MYLVACHSVWWIWEILIVNFHLKFDVWTSMLSQEHCTTSMKNLEFFFSVSVTNYLSLICASKDHGNCKRHFSFRYFNKDIICFGLDYEYHPFRRDLKDTICWIVVQFISSSNSDRNMNLTEIVQFMARLQT